jgi:glucan phosphoethanolaminetransferase (alkaline phosphatase superfamily)
MVAFVLGLLLNFAIVQSVFTFDLTGSTEYIEFRSTTMLTTVGVVAATAVYGVIAWRSARPNWLFVRVAIVAFVLSFLPNIGLLLDPNGPATDEVLVLMSMHVPPAVTCVASLTGWLFERQRSG